MLLSGRRSRLEVKSGDGERFNVSIAMSWVEYGLVSVATSALESRWWRLSSKLSTSDNVSVFMALLSVNV